MKTKIGVFAVLLGITMVFSEEYSQWSRYRPITINTTSSGANVAGTVSNFPVLVRLTSANADVFATALSGGADIRFTDSTGTVRLPHQKERWDTAAQVAEFWVLVPSIAGNANTSIRLYWGKSGVADSSKASQVFTASNGFVSVLHLGDSSGIQPRPNAVSGAPAATPMNFPNGYAPKNGVIGMADSLRGGFPATKDYMDLGTIAGFSDYTTGFTFSAWVYSTAQLKDMPYWSSGNGVSDIIIVGQSGTGTGEKFRFNVGTGSNIGINGGANKIALNQWRRYTYTKGSANGPLRIYINGVLDSTVTGLQDIPNVSRPNNYLGRSYNAPDSNFAGALDEVRLSNSELSANWVKLDYETQKATATAVTLGATVVRVSGSPVIISGPVSKTVLSGATVKFGVVASGNATLVYKWVRRNVDTVGTNSDSLTLTNVSAADTGAYKCVVSNSLGQALTASASLTLAIAPVITNQPLNSFILNAGAGTARFGIKATGSTPLIYQWIRRKNSVIDTLTNTGIFSGATTDTLTVTNPLFPDSGSTFKCSVRNAAGVVVSDSAVLNVRAVLAVFPGKGINSFSIQNLRSSVKFHLPDGVSSARVSVLDIWGRMVWSKTAGGGVHELVWEGSHSGPVAVPGVYLVRLTVQDANHWSRLAGESKVLVTP